ncbi:hypothetical protein LIER_10314 [Lithospermum erythrorhizon]|uniref:Uncharacterized protein n=1 Tax=Lithospermum erythrorhizon TaxID=34254 RepID=A0AAV3PKT9_LITER
MNMWRKNSEIRWSDLLKQPFAILPEKETGVAYVHRSCRSSRSCSRSVSNLFAGTSPENRSRSSTGEDDRSSLLLEGDRSYLTSPESFQIGRSLPELLRLETLLQWFGCYSNW